jgi:hypothetical protein
VSRAARNRERTEQSIRDGFGGDSYRRIEVSPGVYQCGCRWERDLQYGDVLRECVFHRRLTETEEGT